MPKTLEVPVDEFDGKVVYGEKRQNKGNLFKGHVDLLAPSVKELMDLEKKTQITFLNLRYNKSIEPLIR